MNRSETTTVTVAVRNTGNTTWRKNRLHSLGNPDGHDQPFAWPRQTLPAGIEVAPDETYTFSFQITAPAEPGEYTQRWQMVQDAVEWFGDPVERALTVEDRSAVPASHWNRY